MNAYSFDALDAASSMEDAGMERSQAGAIAKAVRDRQGDLATKADITKLEEMVTGIKASIAAFKVKIARLDGNFVVFMWAIGLLNGFTFVGIGTILYIVSRGL